MRPQGSGWFCTFTEIELTLAFNWFHFVVMLDMSALEKTLFKVKQKEQWKRVNLTFYYDNIKQEWSCLSVASVDTCTRAELRRFPVVSVGIDCIPLFTLLMKHNELLHILILPPRFISLSIHWQSLPKNRSSKLKRPWLRRASISQLCSKMSRLWS